MCDRTQAQDSSAKVDMARILFLPGSLNFFFKYNQLLNQVWCNFFRGLPSGLSLLIILSILLGHFQQMDYIPGFVFYPVEWISRNGLTKQLLDLGLYLLPCLVCACVIHYAFSFGKELVLLIAKLHVSETIDKRGNHHPPLVFNIFPRLCQAL
jgi:hypothetical protein